MRKPTLPVPIVVIFCLLIPMIMSLSGCQAGSETPASENDSTPLQMEQPTQGDSSTNPAKAPATTEAAPVDAPQAAVQEIDPKVIEAAWQSSPHADTFVLDANGQNNTCAQCHAPINWQPAMEDLPESCFACKFELEPPPPTIAEGDWVDIPCKICHKVDKKDNVQPEYAWLEIAPLDEYAEVASPTELCLKCHTPVDIPRHSAVQVGGDHPNYQCTDCHSAHDTKTSCDAVGCHSDVVQPANPIPGHDEDHQSVTCGACHDGSGMEVGFDEESGFWTTYASATNDEGIDKFPFTSHNIVLESRCDRCHFIGNPWDLSESVVEP